MKKIKNANDLAKAIAAVEGKKQQVNIAQIKEILKVLALMLKHDSAGAAAFIQYVLKQK